MGHLHAATSTYVTARANTAISGDGDAYHCHAHAADSDASAASDGHATCDIQYGAL